MGRQLQEWRPEAPADGVRVREFADCARIEIDFRYRGVRCRECLNVEVSEKTYAFAVRKRGTVIEEIARGTFRYSDHFPESKRGMMFGQGSSDVTVAQTLESLIKDCERAVQRDKMSPSTLRGYKEVVATLLPVFGTIEARYLTLAQVRAWVKGNDATIKTWRNKLSVLNLALNEAADDGLIEQNPINISALKKLLKKNAKNSTFKVEPFDAAERAALLDACADDEERDMYTFWFETGLRPSELIVLRWDRVDFIHKTVRIDMARVEHTDRNATKTAAGTRDVGLSDDALAAVKRQKARTMLAGRCVWRDPAGSQRAKPGDPWASDQELRDRSWNRIVRKSGVRYRNMYQVRHTFASTHCSKNTNLFWIAAQMGHKSIEVLIRHYGRWIEGFDPRGHVMVTQGSRGAR